MSLQEELKHLREMKESLEVAQVRGDRTVPEWLADNDQLQEMLTYSASGQTGVKLTTASDPSIERRRANRLIKKSAYEVKKLRQIQQRPSLTEFRKKIGSLLGLSPRVAKLPAQPDYFVSDETNFQSGATGVSLVTIGDESSQSESVTYQF